MSGATTTAASVDLEAASLLHAATADLLKTCWLLDYAPAGNSVAIEIRLIQSMLLDVRARLGRAVQQLAPGIYQ